MPYMRARVARDLKDFLHRYQEGALGMLALLDCAGKGGWRGDQSSDISVSEFPGIEGKDAVEVWCLVEKLRVLMREALGERNFSSLFIKYLDKYLEHSYDGLDDRLNYAGFQIFVWRYPIYDNIKYRKDVQSLEKLVKERWSWFVVYHFAAGELWKKISAPVRCYVLCRAADSLSFGERYSSLPRSASAPYEDLVGALVSLSKDTKARLDEAEEKEAAAKERQKIEEECAKKVRDISYIPPAILEARALDAAQIMAVRNACMEEIKHSPKEVYETAATIDESARFCVLLAKPENHIKVRSAQYVEKAVRSMTEIDMVNEAARVLSSVPPYTAYVRLEKKEGETGAWTGKVRMKKLASVSADALQKARRAIEGKVEEYTRPREKIWQEIEERRGRIRVPAPSRQTEAVKEAAPPQRSGSLPEEEPPPPRRAAATKKAQEKKVREDEAFRTQGEHTDAGGPVAEAEGNIKSARAEGPDKPVLAGRGVQRDPQSVIGENPSQTPHMRLVYRSDLTEPSKEWMEITTEKGKVFLRNGCCHIGVNPPGVIVRGPQIAMVDFRVHVDAASVGGRGEDEPSGAVFDTEAYGIVFRMEDKRDASFYCLNIWRWNC
jgi:hypothetical protein